MYIVNLSTNHISAAPIHEYIYNVTVQATNHISAVPIHTYIQVHLYLSTNQISAVPVEEEEREGTHDQEEQYPHPEGCIVLDGLKNNRNSAWLLSMVIVHGYY